VTRDINDKQYYTDFSSFISHDWCHKRSRRAY